MEWLLELYRSLNTFIFILYLDNTLNLYELLGYQIHSNSPIVTLNYNITQLIQKQSKAMIAQRSHQQAIDFVILEKRFLTSGLYYLQPIL